MKSLSLFAGFITIIYSYGATAEKWKDECVSYYQVQLPDTLEVALYPIDLIINPRKNPAWRKNTFVNRYLFPAISFGEDQYQNNIDKVQAQFSVFQYGNYNIIVSSESSSVIDFMLYQKQFKGRTDEHIRDYWDTRKYEASLNIPVLTKGMAEKTLAYSINNYNNAFGATDSGGYNIYINKNKRLYIFNKPNETQSLDEQLKISKPAILSLLNHFQARNLFEIPSEKGFCLPYGFIAGDSGHEPRNMAVTYRLKAHPDVTIFFQDLGMKPKAGKEDDLNDKDYVSWLWNWQYQWSAVSKELIKPKWRTIKMDGRTGLGTFVKAIYKDVPVYDSEGHVINHINYINYGYVAYVRGDHKARNVQPDLLLYVMQDSRQAKNNPPMNAQEIEQMAEHIISTVRRR
ncbi:T6SS immunity protein Tli4 family protein [Cronobacter malonaticus]|uniref:T6SS immunity protein Tli4 family protein n=1 Tax=Cronobacter malonaticus TaxID=413503 RepID=UPI0018F87EBD|nr:T6SS immunity protein Tli4 family protein [Cronobacter malonaticus]MDT3579593.1 T6SS immunity protein Tli4 family protein [Cronobacter malonaticus]